MSRRRALAPLLVWFVCACSCPALAQSTSSRERAAAAYERGELDVALALYDEALRAGALEGPALVTVAMRLAVLRAATGDAPGARTAMRTALLVEPDLVAPPELDDATRAVLERERAELAGPIVLELGGAIVVREGRARLDVALSRSAGVVTELAASLSVEGALPELAVVDRDAREVGWSRSLEGQDSASVRVEARDAHGNVLARVERTVPIEHPLPELALSATTPPARDDTSLWVGLGVGGGVLLVGAIVVVAVVLATPSDRVGAPVVERTP